MKKYLLLTLILASTNLLADTIFGVYAGVQTWLYDNSGDLAVDNNYYDAFRNIDKNSETSNSGFIALEHALPFVPNIKLKHTNFEINKFITSGTAGCPAVFPNICFESDTNIDLSHTDVTFYYEILDNWVNLDLGLSAIYFNGKIDFQSEYPNTNYSKFTPALYGKAMFELPITDLSASLTANIGTLTDYSIVDYELAAQYKIGLGFSVEAGLKQQTIDFNSNDIDINSDATGVFAALNFHF